MKGLLKNSLHIRGDNLFCSLAFSLDTYSNCEANCRHCYLRRLNYVWDKELRPMDVEHFKKTLENGIKNKNPQSPLAWAIHHRKTIRFGNKADPFQEAEYEHRVSKEALLTLKEYKWPVVIETKFTHILREYDEILSDMRGHLHIMPIISPGYISDWEVFENKITTAPDVRLEHLQDWVKRGFRVGVNGEPFIPGYHTIDQFEEMLKRLKAFSIPSYNTYNLHWNDFVAKRFVEIGIDIEKINYYNVDEHWKPILLELIELSKKYGIVLGCPDWINSGDYASKANTCCGINCDNPTTWNAPTIKKKLFKGVPFEKAIDECWDNVGNYERGREIFIREFVENKQEPKGFGF